MKNKRADISQIQDYLKGKLDSKAMHQLEREAQDDPFLADAIDGYVASADQEQNLEILKERLQQRTETRVRRILPWSTITIAASVIGFFVVAGLYFMRNDSGKPALQIAVNEIAKPAPLTAAPAPLKDSSSIQTDKPKFASPQKKERQLSAYNVPALKPKRSYQKPTIVIDDNAPVLTDTEFDKHIDQVNSSAKNEALGYSSRKRQDTVLGGGNIAINKTPSAVTMLRSKADGVTYKERDRQSASATAALVAANLPTNINGKITDDAGLPLPGATVQIAGKTIGTTTDANGRFTLHNVSPQDQVVYNYIGFDKKVLPAKTGDSVKVALHESSAALSEVVVVANAKRSGSKAEPKTGWKAYKEYLKTEAIVGQGEKAGQVQLTFTVDPNGKISKFKVLKSLSPEADKKAIDLIQNGADWFGNLNGKPEQVKLAINFKADSK